MQLTRQKTKHTKVRTGCVTCKDRKVKCTEEKPYCLRCVRLGKSCGGYDTPRTWLFEPQKQRDHGAKETVVTRSPPWSSVLLPDETDRRSFDFYVDQTAPILSAYFGHSFWSRTLPQASLRDPMVKEMVLATSSLIESNELRLSLLQENLVYQANYKRVIRRMTSGKVPSTEYVLMACLLLACCDFCVGEFQAGMQHIMSGIHILDEWYRFQYLSKKVTTQEANLILTELAPLFASIVQKIPTYGLSVGLHPGMMLKLVPSRELPHAPKTFSNIHQARHTMDGIAHHVVKLMQPPTDLLGQASIVPQLKNSLIRFREALDSFERQLPPMKRDRLQVWLSLMRVHHRVLTISAGVFPILHDSLAAHFSFQLDFDAILDEYAEIILRGPRTTILSRPSTSCDSDRLQWHCGFIPPLFFVATRCPIPHTRLKALHLLRSLRVQEKNWNSCIAATAVDMFIKHRTTLFWDPIPPKQENITVPACLCNEGIEWSHVRRLIELSGYQGATMTLPADCTCDMDP